MARGGMSSDGMKKLQGDIQTMQRQSGQFLHKFLLQMGQRAIDKVKPRTPVDTGDLRNHWTLTDVFRRGDELMIVMHNPMQYASHVEYGHAQEVGRYVPAIGKRLVKPWVDGYYMATISMQEIERELPARLKAAWAKFYRDLRKE